MGDDLPVQSTAPGLVERAKAILIQPKAEWPRIAAERTEPGKVLTGLVKRIAAGATGASIGGPEDVAAFKASLRACVWRLAREFPSKVP